MKLKLDENLPLSLKYKLEALGHEVHTVGDERLIGVSDQILWNSCCDEGRVLLTQDLDFSDVNRFVPGTHPGIIVLRLKEPNRRALHNYVSRLFETEDVRRWSGCIVIASDRKIRVKR